MQLLYDWLVKKKHETKFDVCNVYVGLDKKVIMHKRIFWTNR